jgi:hypothetical protein
MDQAGSTMPNRGRLRGPSTHPHRDDVSDAEGWVFVAFCVVGYAAIVFLIFLSSVMGQTIAG